MSAILASRARSSRAWFASSSGRASLSVMFAFLYRYIDIYRRSLSRPFACHAAHLAQAQCRP